MARRVKQGASAAVTPGAGSGPSVQDAQARTSTKTAVIMIHGMGEQWPMDTLRGFVDAVWKHDDDLIESWAEGEIYVKPERLTGSFELRRITTRYWRRRSPLDAPARRIDFFEFYWAHLLRDTTLASVLSWLVRLLVRRPARVPHRLFWGWLAGLFILCAGVVLAILTAFAPDLTRFGVPIWIWGLFGAAGAGFSAIWLRPVAGDAARYLSPSPGNVAQRQAIRDAGIDLLTKIHATGDYDRVIVAGHSLGSVIGYDVLHYAWSRLDKMALKAAHGETSSALRDLKALEAAAQTLKDEGSEADPTEYRTCQRTYFDSLAKARTADGKPLWLVSDFMTMGSPLSSADVLLARDKAALDARIAERDAPTCPPQSEWKTGTRFSYPPEAKVRMPHHGAVFAPVVWTNIFYPNVMGVFGDFVSGPVRPLLGRAIRDVKVPIGAPAFRHLSYWSDPRANGPAIRALRRALNLRRRSEGETWGGLTATNPVPAARLADVAHEETATIAPLPEASA